MTTSRSGSDDHIGRGTTTLQSNTSVLLGAKRDLQDGAYTI